MPFCINCGSSDVLELGIEKDEAWYYCYACKSCFEVYFPNIPLEEFAIKLEEQGFIKDAERFRKGERVSEFGE